MGNTLEMVKYAKKNLQDEHVTEAVKKDKGSGATWVDFRLKDFTKKGDNYIGVVTCLHVNYALGNEYFKETYIAKLSASQSTKALTDMVMQGSIKEKLFYQEILPALNKELRDVNLPTLRTPICFFANNDPMNSVLILSDVRSQNFKSVPGKSCLDLPHIHVALQELARFHASSLLLIAKTGCTNFYRMCSKLDKEWYNVTDDAIAFFKTLFDGNIENAIAILNALEGDERAINWLKEIKPNVYEILHEQMEKDTVFTTLCHADSVSNNILFRYNESHEPVEALLLDFQIVRIASLVTDLHLLLNISVNGSDRKVHLRNFLETYYNAFKAVFKAAGKPMPFDLEQLLQEYNRKAVFGALWALAIIPMMTSGGEISDWTGNEEPDSLSEQSREQEVQSKISGKHSQLRDRFLPIFDNLIELGVIS